MTNYVNYPGHRFERGTCIICFDGSYSWCILSKGQKKYLAESGYLDDATRIDIKYYNGRVYSLSVDQFKEWVNSGKPEPDANNDYAISSIEEKLCPQCGKPMVIRIARRGPGAGKRFWGCTGYPECTRIEKIEESRME